MNSVISSSSFYGALRSPIQRLQQELNRSQVEISSGSLADPGLELGGGITTDVAARNELANLNAFSNGAKVASDRLAGTQSAIGSISDVLQSFQTQLIGAQSGTVDPALLQETARSTLGLVLSALNTSVGGVNLFGGVNSSGQTIASYFATPASPAKAALDSAFQSAFSFTQGSTGSSAISGAAMQGFLDGPYGNQFSAASWKANWSSASDSTINNEILPGSLVATSVTANDSGIRGAVSALVMVADLGIASLGADARNAVISSSLTQIGAATSALTGLSAKVGLTQAEIDSSSKILMARTTSLQSRINSFETIDTAAAAMDASTLTTQLQSAYSLTARINDLSLLKYI